MTDQVQLHSPPVLSTPESHIFEDPKPLPTSNAPRLTDREIWDVYEITRTAREIRDGGWRRIALQFPDEMLGDGVRVFEGLEKELASLPRISNAIEPGAGVSLEQDFTKLATMEDGIQEAGFKAVERVCEGGEERYRLYILADTSYGACCVDEIAAEHVDAEVVVHYGRSCLSPMARLPVIYVFTSRPLNFHDVVTAFEDTYAGSTKQEDGSGGGNDGKVILMADVMYNSHVLAVKETLESRGWRKLIAPDVVHDPSSLIPNRKVEVEEEDLKTYSIFHISDPPPALLLTLSSRVKDLHIYPTTSSSSTASTSNSILQTQPGTKTVQSNTSMALRRRYGLLTSLSTCGIFGILINTLSVRNYLQTVSKIQTEIASVGKKSYTFVVGKVNAAKIANFSEIGGWVVVGCWESSLIESTEFYRPIITPFELRLALMSDDERVWSGGWRGDFESLPSVGVMKGGSGEVDGAGLKEVVDKYEPIDGGDLDSEEESEPPEFDLRTGRYVSHSRPMRAASSPLQTTTSISSNHSSLPQEASSKSLARRAKLDLATVNGAISPAAEYLRSQRTWTGLGSDFPEEEAGLSIEEGRSGVARGYTVGEGGNRT